MNTNQAIKTEVQYGFRIPDKAFGLFQRHTTIFQQNKKLRIKKFKFVPAETVYEAIVGYLMHCHGSAGLYRIHINVNAAPNEINSALEKFVNEGFISITDNKNKPIKNLDSIKDIYSVAYVVNLN